jgi:thiol:disulfide interchange protein DsbD
MAFRRYADALRAAGSIRRNSRVMYLSYPVGMILAAIALFAAVPVPGSAHQGPPGPKAEDMARVRLAGTTASISPGEQFHIAVIFDIERAWHIYWQNPGEGAPPPDVKLTAPAGFTIGSIQFPRPVIIKDAVGEMYCHERQAVLLVPVTAPATLSDGNATFAADVRFAVCKELCLMGSTKQTVSIPTTSASSAPSGQEAIDSSVTRALKRMPQPMSKLSGATARYSGGMLRVSGPLSGFKTVQFFPHGSPGVSFSKPKVEVAGDQFEVTTRVEIDRANLAGQKPFAGGLIGLGEDSADPSYELRIDVE